MFEKVTGRQWGAREREAWRRERRETLVFSCPLLPPVGWGEGDFFFFVFLFPSIFFSLFLTIFYLFFYFSGMFREGGEKWNSSGNPLAKQKRRRSKREQAGVSLLICCACTRHPYSSSSFSFIETWWRDIIMENRKGYQYERYSHTHTHNTHT